MTGAYNFGGDGNIEQWIATLDAAKKLGAQVVCPGHGPRGAETVLADQQLFFQQLREKVGSLVKAKKSPREVHQAVEQIRGELVSQPRIARYMSKDSLAPQVEKVLKEMTGQGFPADAKTSGSARLLHARAHALHLV